MVPIAILSSELKILSVIEVVTVTCNILRSHWGTQCNEIKLLPPKYIYVKFIHLLLIKSIIYAKIDQQIQDLKRLHSQHRKCDKRQTKSEHRPMCGPIIFTYLISFIRFFNKFRSKTLKIFSLSGISSISSSFAWSLVIKLNPFADPREPLEPESSLCSEVS